MSNMLAVRKEELVKLNAIIVTVFVWKFPLWIVVFDIHLKLYNTEYANF